MSDLQFNPRDERGLFAAMPHATDDDAEGFRGCVQEFMHQRLTYIVGESETMNSSEAWIHRLLIEMMEALDTAGRETANAEKKKAAL